MFLLKVVNDTVPLEITKQQLMAAVVALVVTIIIFRKMIGCKTTKPEDDPLITTINLKNSVVEGTGQSLPGPAKDIPSETTPVKPSKFTITGNTDIIADYNTLGTPGMTGLASSPLSQGDLDSLPLSVLPVRLQAAKTPYSITTTPRHRKRWHSMAYLNETTIKFEGTESFGAMLKGHEIAGHGHEVKGCHIVGFTTETRNPGCEGLKDDMTIVEINGKDVTKCSIDEVRAMLSGRPITTHWVLFENIEQCPDTPDVVF